MNNKLSFFDDTFRILFTLTISVWALYVALVIFATEGQSCMPGTSNGVLGVCALVTGVLSAPPLLYGLVRLLAWPDGPRIKNLWLIGLIIGAGVIVFVALATFLAMAIAQYGCR